MRNMNMETTEMEISNWFKGFEKGIARLSPEDEAAAEKAARESTARQKELAVKKKLWEKYDKQQSKR